MKMNCFISTHKMMISGRKPFPLLILLLIGFRSITLFADSADPSDPLTWTVTPANYDYDMTMTAVINFNMNETTDPNDMIAAFVGDDCRGAEYASTVIEGRYLAYLRIYGNKVTGDTLSLYIYDASEDKIEELIWKVPFEPQANYGTQNDPFRASVVFDLKFTISYEEVPVVNATVLLEGYGEQMTDPFGEVLFADVIPSVGIRYSVMKAGFEELTDTAQVNDADVNEGVELVMLPKLDAANVITPNDDGYNDFWEIYNIENYSGFDVSIYSTAGERLFSTTDYPNNKWDGKAGERQLPDGIYYYIVISPYKDLVFKGVINLIN